MQSAQMPPQDGKFTLQAALELMGLATALHVPHIRLRMATALKICKNALDSPKKGVSTILSATPLPYT